MKRKGAAPDELTDQQRGGRKPADTACEKQERPARNQSVAVGQIDERIADGDVADPGKILREQSFPRELKRVEQAVPCG